MSDLPYSALRQAKEVMGFSDGELAEVLGCSKAHVYSIVSGRYNEGFSPKQRAALIAYCRLYRDQVIQAVDEIEMLA